MIEPRMRINKIKFGKFIAARREQVKGVETQEQLAEKLHVSTGYIGKLEIGGGLPSFELFIDLADALQMTPGELMMVLAEREEPIRAYQLDNWFYDRIKSMLSEYEQTLNRPGAISPMPVYRLEEVNENDLANQKRSDTLALEEFKKRGQGKDKDKDNTPSNVESEKPPEQI